MFCTTIKPAQCLQCCFESVSKQSLFHDAGIVGADAVPVPVHWESSNGTWVRTTSSDPASPGTPVRLPSGTSPSLASAAASASGTATLPCDLQVPHAVHAGWLHAIDYVIGPPVLFG